MKKINVYCSFIMLTIFCASPLSGRHGSNVMVGAGLGTAFGAMLGGSDGIIPGLITGMAVGTTAEILDNDQRNHKHHKHHCHTVVYKDEPYQSRRQLEKELEELDYAYEKLHRYCQRLEQEMTLKDQEIMRLRKKIKNLEYDLTNQHRTSFCITTQTIL